MSMGAEEPLLDAFRTLDAARSLSDILDALLRSARVRTNETGLLLVAAGAPRAWESPAAAPPEAASQGPDTPDVARLVVDAATSGHTSRDGALVAVPLLIAGQVIAVLWARGAEGSDDLHEPLELLARHAARCLEVLTAFRTVQFLARGADAPAARNGDDDQAARRYARLLVSEIRLYHEREIAEGQRQRDLMSRLGGEIARAQAMYDERVPAAVRLETDYFRTELVRTLAGGDASLLASLPARQQPSSAQQGS
jgi:hypothetical protein